MTTPDSDGDSAPEQAAGVSAGKNTWQVEAMLRPGLRIDPERLPQTVDFSASPLASAAFCIIGLAAAGIGLSLLVGSGFSDGVTLLLAISMLVLGLPCAYVGYSAWQDKSCITFGKSGVVIEERVRRSMQKWQAPYSAFEGVLIRSEKVTWRMPDTKSDVGAFWGAFGGRRGPTVPPPPRIFQIVELKHGDALRTLPLRVAEEDKPDRTYWARMALALGVPALELRHGQIVSRTAEEAVAAVDELPESARVPDVGSA